MTTPRVGVALLGLGAWGSRWLPTLLRNPRADLRWACDPNPTLGEGRPYWAPELAVALRDPAVEAVVIATPPHTHAELAARVLRSGRHACVEKPLATDTQSALELQRLAQAQGRVLMVNHLLAYHPAVRGLMRQLSSGRWGRVRGILGRRHSTGPGRRDSALWALGPHDVSLLLRICPELVGRLSCRTNGDEVLLCAEHEGVECELSLSVRSSRKARRFAVLTEGATLILDDLACSPLAVFPPQTSIRQLSARWARGRVPAGGTAYPVESGLPLDNAVDHFLDSIVARKRPYTDGSEGALVVSVLDRLASIKSSKPRSKAPGLGSVPPSTLLSEAALPDTALPGRNGLAGAGDLGRGNSPARRANPA